ncbi:glucose inhibited division protein B [Bordetella bronchiseptica RB50]|uniref:Ribosomal RNA small subunit methyltransferase G n=2 Tax=Bordetella TaxID=517 RepID=RSMG_BORBR|nr:MULTISPECIES: 16S rRNA (guanine(527)-N(7))-methyltransferase RsmG [Bordetella]Q7WRF0.1 RecName: Full=Ribosomal RNA small subunit methyltransferase G; AltName: Full=16S rRNA 7-methylguanosine methyltransferase; Short=16S rRNA m7G methyltransferase [Bordetella bronchiseptica RB50]AMG86624.1 ribosomal RNA small subunit methyltransferase G [Bordetella bronchiseptica]CAE30504.1 glucose inhibited division protein B [Bordetella bronchiseptica RB50]CCJ47335.1 glucose inhibited division protein B [Bo
MSAVPDIPGGPAQRLAQACDALRLPADAGQQQKLLRYIEQMQRWNRTYNLTAIRDPGQMLVQHLFDSLSVVAPLERGLPGVVLAIMRAHWDVTCVDAVEKKTAFVRQMAGALGLPNLQAAHTRIEQLEPAQCDVVISRAFASLQDFAKLAGRHVREGGTLVAMKGKVPDDEIQALQQHGHWTVERIEPLVVPALDAQRCLIWMRRSQGNI